jgi:hypothetical protein
MKARHIILGVTCVCVTATALFLIFDFRSRNASSAGSGQLISTALDQYSLVDLPNVNWEGETASDAVEFLRLMIEARRIQGSPIPPLGYSPGAKGQIRVSLIQQDVPISEALTAICSQTHAKLSWHDSSVIVNFE